MVNLGVKVDTVAQFNILPTRMYRKMSPQMLTHGSSATGKFCVSHGHGARATQHTTAPSSNSTDS